MKKRMPLIMAATLLSTFVMGAATGHAEETTTKRSAVRTVNDNIETASIKYTEKSVQEYVEQLIADESITVSNVTMTGSKEAIAAFNNGKSSLGIDSGVLLSTGRVQSTKFDLGEKGDKDIESLINGTSFDAIALEFDFVSKYSNVTMNYVFGSKEYIDFASGSFNDVFGFFIDGVNQAFIPNTNDLVSIKTVNSKINSQYFIDNADKHLGKLPATDFGGVTTPLPINVQVTPNKSHHIKIVIADVKDAIGDSFIGLSDKSLRSTGRVNINYTDADGKKIAEPTVINGAIGEAYTAKEKTIDGYKFSHWNGESSGKIGESVTDITAVYTRTDSFHINFSTNGGTSVTSLAVAPNGVATKPTDPVKDGYIFDGWYTDAELTTPFDFSQPITKDVELFAKWKKENASGGTDTGSGTPTADKFKVTFNTNDGSKIPTQEIEAGELLIQPTDPTRTGYAFKGWFTDEKLTTAFDFTKPITADITLYAKWEKTTGTGNSTSTGGNTTSGLANSSKNSTTSGKNLPSTGEIVQSGLVFAGLALAVGLSFIVYTKNFKPSKKRK